MTITQISNGLQNIGGRFQRYTPMREYLVVGSTPIDEQCIQVRSNSDYLFSMKKECDIYKRQLERLFPDPPDGVWFSIKSFDHDFGMYTEVCVFFDGDDEIQSEYASDVDSSLPEKWDSDALAELRQIDGYERLCA